MIHAPKANSQVKISLNWITLTAAKITFKNLKLLLAWLSFSLDQVFPSFAVVLLSVVTLGGDNPIRIEC